MKAHCVVLDCMEATNQISEGRRVPVSFAGFFPLLSWWTSLHYEAFARWWVSHTWGVMGSSRERMKSISEVCDERATQPVFSIYSSGQRNVHLRKKDEEKSPKNASRRGGLQIQWRMWWDFSRTCQDELWDRGCVLKTLVKFYGQELSLNSFALCRETSSDMLDLCLSADSRRELQSPQNSNYCRRPCS